MVRVYNHRCDLRLHLGISFSCNLVSTYDPNDGASMDLRPVDDPSFVGLVLTAFCDKLGPPKEPFGLYLGIFYQMLQTYIHSYTC